MLMATSTFGLERKWWSSTHWCYLHQVYTFNNSLAKFELGRVKYQIWDATAGKSSKNTLLCSGMDRICQIVVGKLVTILAVLTPTLPFEQIFHQEQKTINYLAKKYVCHVNDNTATSFSKLSVVYYYFLHQDVMYHSQKT